MVQARPETTDEPVAIPAATIVLYRETGSGPAEHLMIERTAGMAFAAGALVFPGGRIDADDRKIACDEALLVNAPQDRDDCAARVAAIREALEETGVAVGIEGTFPPSTLREWQKGLKAGKPFSHLLEAAGATLDLGELVLFARWSPKLGEVRRFDTRFYIARINGQDEISLDVDEAATHRWLTAQQAIDDAKAGHHHIIFPTMRNLERLATCPRFDDAIAHLARTPLRTISPEIREYDAEKWLCIPTDAGYPVTRVPLAQVIGP